MMEYQSFCYLQNHKTGCTFVEEFLHKFSAEPLVKYDKHAVAATRDPAKFYFVNVREPIELYRSLYAYGLDGRGQVWERLTRLGLASLYANGPAGFSEWLRFVLDPANALALDNKYTPEVAGRIGFMSWRFFRLAVIGFEAAAPALKDRKEMNDFARKRFFMNAVLKQETLRDGLAELARGPLAKRLTNVEEAVAWIAASPKINVSESIKGADEVPIDADALQRLFSNERRLYRFYYADAPGFAEWRASREA